MHKNFRKFRTMLTGPVMTLFFTSFLVPFSAFLLQTWSDCSENGEQTLRNTRKGRIMVISGEKGGATRDLNGLATEISHRGRLWECCLKKAT